jgi:tape measure domain-containing protein
VTIGLALDTSAVLAGTRQVDAALKSVATASTTTAQATQKLDQAAKTAGQALGTESKAAQTATQSLRQMGQAAQGASQQIGGIGSAMRSFASQTGSFALAQVGVLGLQAALSTAKDALVDLVKTGITMQNLRTSFTAASGSAKAGAEDFRFVVKTANELGLGLQSVAEQYRSLAAATRGTTLQGAETREIFVTLSKAAQAYGLSNEQLGRAMTALQQIISKGKVSMEELRGQLGEALPGALQVAARAYGVTTQALEAMIEKGVAGEEFARKWITQLGAEIPAAAGRAGSGIAKFGNEILLLKDSIAKSVGWIDTLIGKIGHLMGKTREAEEKLERGAARRAERGVGAETFEGLSAAARAQLTEQQRRVDDTKAAYEARLKVQPEGTDFLGLKTQTQVAKELYETEQKRNETLRARLVLGDAESKERATAAAAATTANKDQQAQVAAINTFLTAGKTLLETQRKETEAIATATKAGLGRDPTAEEKAKLGEKQLKDAQEFLATNSKLAEQHKDDPVVKALRDRGQAAEAATKAVADGKKEAKDDAREAKAAETELERLDKERRDNVLASGKLIHEGYEKEGDLIGDLMERIRQLTMTEDERWALKLKAITDPALQAYAKQLLEEYQLALKRNEALKERPRILADQARASAAELSALDKAQAAFTARKGEKPADTETRLDAAYRALEQTEGVEPFRLAEAAAKWEALMKKGLDTEMWNNWRDVGLDALDHVGQALEDFAFKGKLNFKGMMDAIAQDLFRFATQTLMQSATKKGGWLEVGLDLGMKALSIYTKAPGGGAPLTGGDAPGMQHGGPVSAGRPYMVGEAGPELYVPKTSGTIIPNSKLGGGPTVINVHVSGVQDAQSFVQSRGAVSRAMMGALSQARQQM